MVTKQARKQRKNLYNAPLHERNSSMSAVLSKELQKKHSKKNMPVVKGDKVQVMRGNFAGVEGEVLKVIPGKYTIHVKGVTLKNSRGEDVQRPIHPSNVRITEIKLEDKKREAKLNRK